MAHCNYKILHHNQHGYIVKCTGCNHIKMAYGTTAVTFSRSGFYDFMQLVEQEYHEKCTAEFQDHKSICLPTTDSTIQLVYSPDEIKQLKVLLEEAWLSLQIEQVTSF